MKRDKNIDKIIKRNLDFEKPSSVFSSKVMQQIHTLENANEKALSSLLQKHTLENPSANFTSKIMQEINTNKTVTAYQPVIGKKVWFVIFSALLFLVILTLINSNNTPEQYKYVDDIINKFNHAILFKVPAILFSPILALSLFALSSLLFIDRFLHRKNMVKTH